MKVKRLRNKVSIITSFYPRTIKGNPLFSSEGGGELTGTEKVKKIWGTNTIRSLGG